MSGVSRRRLTLDAMAALGFVLLPMVFLGSPDAGSGAGAARIWLLSLLAALPLTVRSVWPVPTFGLVLAVACLAVPLGLPSVSAFAAAAYALYQVAVTRTPRTEPSPVLIAGLCAAVAVALAASGTQRHTDATRVVDVLLGLLTLGIAWASGAAIRQRRERARSALERAAEQATLEERLRIARDMHDIVSSSVGLIAVKAAIASHVASNWPAEAQQTLAAIEDVSRTALREVRTTLMELRRLDENEQDRRVSPLPGMSDLPALVTMAEAAGVRVQLLTCAGADLPDGVALSAFRIVQEALANVVKHAAPTRCRVRLVADPSALTIEVVDEGGGATPGPVRSGGLGLVGMRERAAAHGGTLTAGPLADGGFRVVAVLPLQPGPQQRSASVPEVVSPSRD